MADRFTDEQVATIKRAIDDVADGAGRSDLGELVNALRSAGDIGLSASDIDSVVAAVASLEVPLDARPQWNSEGKRGLFFVFEGLDRSGKSTQSKLLAKHLEETGTVRWTCFPDRSTAVGSLIDLYLRNKIELSDEAVHRLFSANRWESCQTILTDLNKGVSIVCDRYAFSGVAYSSAKGLDLAWCQAPDRGLPLPDGVFFLHIDEKVGASRSNFGDERYENADMQARVRAQFQLAEIRNGVAWHDVDGARDIEVIQKEIAAAAGAVCGAEFEGDVRPIPRLWAV
eukprot:TRINITY_DN73595_c0_g1_i1.p1 TRINITY_DN73595_c0_g1~~TRINITY_DN73595_c0_g1_i1.p1  ORF type:complete len:303 (-),score=49.53 TRINITY_DN73595_c0_g1_i1:220-1074(-)